MRCKICHQQKLWLCEGVCQECEETEQEKAWKSLKQKRGLNDN